MKICIHKNKAKFILLKNSGLPIKISFAKDTYHIKFDMISIKHGFTFIGVLYPNIHKALGSCSASELKTTVVVNR